MKKIISILVVLTLAAAVFGQYRETTTPSLQSRFTQPQSGLFSGLFNSANLDMSHSISVGYASSSGGGMMTGTYLNSMRYRISPKMLLNLKLGFMTQPYSTYEYSPQGSNNTRFLGGAELVYRPSKNMIFSIGVNNMPFYYSNRAYPSHLYNYPFGAFSYPQYQSTPADITGDSQP